MSTSPHGVSTHQLHLPGTQLNTAAAHAARYRRQNPRGRGPLCGGSWVWISAQNTPRFHHWLSSLLKDCPRTYLSSNWTSPAWGTSTATDFLLALQGINIFISLTIIFCWLEQAICKTGKYSWRVLSCFPVTDTVGWSKATQKPQYSKDLCNHKKLKRSLCSSCWRSC